jgi:cytochrome c biogenesis protein CcdA
MQNPADKEPAQFSVFGRNVKDDAETEGKIKTEPKKAERPWQEWKYEQEVGNMSAGVIVLAVGVVLLFNTMGIVAWEFWQVIIPFWPVLLIIMGLQLILGGGWISRIAMLLITVFVLIYIIAYGLLAIDSPLVQYIPTGTMPLWRQPVF